MLTNKQLRTKALPSAEVKAECEKLADGFSLLDDFLKACAAQGQTQAQVADKIGPTQSAVVRMQSGSGKYSPSLVTLTKYAGALGCKLEVRLVPKPRPARNLTIAQEPQRPSALWLDFDVKRHAHSSGALHALEY
jgi:transcriptional regulator with XRE-family HTH domain